MHRGMLLITITIIASLALLLFMHEPTTAPEPLSASADMPAPSPTAAVLAAAPPSPTAAATLALDQRLYIVKPGDNLYRIARLYNLPLETLIAANNLGDPSRLQVGQGLFIPEAGVTPATPAPLGSPLYPTPAPLALKPTPPAAAIMINGVPAKVIVYLPPEVIENARAIFAYGQTLGRNPRAFSKLGDSTIENPHFLARFDEGAYNLGEYAYLQPVIDHFRGSFGRQGEAVHRGLHAWTVFAPLWANRAACAPGEHMLACEFRLHNPSLVFIRLGSNDAGIPKVFDERVREIVQYCIAQGVIPIISTKADRFERGDINNPLLRQIAADFRVPVWDFDAAAGALPGRGLQPDGVHLTTFFAHDYTLPDALQRGHSVSNLTALMMLDRLWREVMGSG